MCTEKTVMSGLVDLPEDLLGKIMESICSEPHLCMCVHVPGITRVALRARALLYRIRNMYPLHDVARQFLPYIWVYKKEKIMWHTLADCFLSRIQPDHVFMYIHSISALVRASHTKLLPHLRWRNLMTPVYKPTYIHHAVLRYIHYANAFGISDFSVYRLLCTVLLYITHGVYADTPLVDLFAGALVTLHPKKILQLHITLPPALLNDMHAVMNFGEAHPTGGAWAGEILDAHAKVPTHFPG
jgi:hypothetical protein